jgi:uncharacterized protein with NRDE domain
MCLILFAFQASQRWPFIVAANRDEAYDRPAQSAAFWLDQPQIFAGRDLQLGGTWMGLSTLGRFAAVTNFRDGLPKGLAPRSRGELVSHYLSSQLSAKNHFEQLQSKKDQYAGFSSLAGNLNELWYFSNYSPLIQSVPPGVHGLSNHLLNTPWPKVTQGKAQLTKLIQHETHSLSDDLMCLLAERELPPASQLPDTGIGALREKELGPKFIAVDNRYGTRASTVILIDQKGNALFREKSFSSHGQYIGEISSEFRVTI